jgi:hypothetical protein
MINSIEFEQGVVVLKEGDDLVRSVGNSILCQNVKLDAEIRAHNCHEAGEPVKHSNKSIEGVRKPCRP